jgi:hypothetical protein
MTLPRCLLIAFVGGGLVSSFQDVRPSTPSQPSTTSATRPDFAKAYGDLPLSFELNVGQTNPSVKFLSRGRRYSLFLTGSEAVLWLQSGDPARAIPQLRRNPLPEPGPAQPGKSASLRMSFVGANPKAEITGLEELPGKTNYLVGNDRKKWRTGVPTYARVKYQAIYPGIDLVYYGNQGQLEYDIVVAPGADPKQIVLSFEGSAGMRVDPGTGDLLIKTAAGMELRHMRPKVFQQVGDQKVEVAGGYRVQDESHAAFTLAAYDPHTALVIDPTVTFTTFLGGSSRDFSSGVAVDASGNAFITGFTSSSDFLIVAGVGPISKNCQPSASQESCPPLAFVTKLSPTGGVVFSTYIGGSGLDDPRAVAVDSSGVFVTGYTDSPDFGGLEFGALQNQYAFGHGDVFVAKLSPNGQAYFWVATFGGVDIDAGNAITVDSKHAAYVAGITYSVDFPTSLYFSTTLKPMQKAFGGVRDGFVVKVDPSGFLNEGYSTYLGGSGFDAAQGIAVDSAGSAYVTGITASVDFPTVGAKSLGFPGGGGTTAFVTKLRPDGSGAVYSIYLGGTLDATNPAPADEGAAIVVDGAGSAYVTGDTCSANFPTTASAAQAQKLAPCGSTFPFSFSAFATKLSNAGGLLFSTYLGGADGNTDGSSIGVNRLGEVYVAGDTSSTKGFPLAPAIIPNPSAGFLTKFSPNLSTIGYTTFLGTQITGVAVFDPQTVLVRPADLYTTGVRLKPNTTNQDAFVVKLNDNQAVEASP